MPSQEKPAQQPNVQGSQAPSNAITGASSPGGSGNPGSSGPSNPPSLAAASYFLQVFKKWEIGSVPTDALMLEVEGKDGNSYAVEVTPVDDTQPLVKQIWDTLEANKWQPGWSFTADATNTIQTVGP